MLKLKYTRFESKGALLGIPELSQRRLWVSRLITNLFAEGALIISVDEAALQLDMHKKKQWTPGVPPGVRDLKRKAGKVLDMVNRSVHFDKKRLRVQKVPNKQQSMTLISAISNEGHVANQIIEGAADSVIYANFMDSFL